MVNLNMDLKDHKHLQWQLRIGQNLHHYWEVRNSLRNLCIIWNKIMSKLLLIVLLESVRPGWIKNMKILNFWSLMRKVGRTFFMEVKEEQLTINKVLFSTIGRNRLGICYFRKLFSSLRNIKLMAFTLTMDMSLLRFMRSTSSNSVDVKMGNLFTHMNKFSKEISSTLRKKVDTGLQRPQTTPILSSCSCPKTSGTSTQISHLSVSLMKRKPVWDL